MVSGTDARPPLNEASVLDFARAFRTAARAVSFYPSTHQSVVVALDKVVSTCKAASTAGPLCLTILPGAFLAGGAPIDSSETVVGELAGILHRHGVGALSLDSRATVESWRALFLQLARKPEELRAAGGIQKVWRSLRHPSPALLEVDFGALLRGQVGGDYDELAGIISHYLETAGVGASLLEDPCAALRRAIEAAPGDEQAVAAVLRELRAAAQLTWATAPQEFDEVFTRASTIGEHLSLALMAGLLDQRGSAAATLGTLDLVVALTDRMSDTTLSRFLVNVLAADGASSPRFNEVMTTLAPDAGRRRRIVVAAQGVAFESGGVLEQWDELERNLDEYLDARFVPEQYARELHAAKTRRMPSSQRESDPPERVAAWSDSIAEPAVDALDLQLLLDLSRLEDEPTRVLAVMELLRGHVADAIAEDRWSDAATVAEAIQMAAADSDHPPRRSAAADALTRLAASPGTERALAHVMSPSEPPSEAVTRLVNALGAGLLPAIVRSWSGDLTADVRERLQRHVADSGDAGRRALRRLLATDKQSAPFRLAAIRLLRLTACGVDLTSTFEASLADPDPDVRAAAFDALADIGSDRARDALAAGIAGAPADGQEVLIGRVVSMARDRAVPLLARLVRGLDQATVPPRALGAVISALADAGTDDAARALMQVFAQTSWRAPHRALRYRMAAAAGLRRIGGPWAAAGLRALAGVTSLVPPSPRASDAGRTDER